MAREKRTPRYLREGPGVSKTQPMKKKSFIILFEMYFGNFGKLLTANMLAVLLSIPILTNGLADVGLTNITRNIFCGRHSFGASDYFETIKKNWKQALIIGILRILFLFVIVFATFSYATTEGNFAAVGLGICIFVLFGFYCMQNYISLLTITFNFSIKKIIVNSFKLVFLNLWKNFIVLFCDLVVAGLAVFSLFYGDSNGVIFTIALVLIICFYPAFRSLCVQFCVFPTVKKLMIDPYYEEHPDADIELRRSMGFLQDESEGIFEDTV